MKTTKLFQKIAFAAFSLAVFAAPSVYPQASLPAPRQEKLLNGLKILMWSDAKADKVSVRIRIHSGSAFDPQGREGLMQMLADNIFPNEVSREFFAEDLGGNLEIVTNYDYIQINASSKPEGFLQMMETLSTAVSNPVIDKETTAKLKTALLAKVATMESDPAYVADQAVAKRLFGTFPYGRPTLGTADSLKKIDFADLIDAKARFMTADNATVTISGNFDPSLGFKAIRRFFGGWLKADRRVPSTFKQPDPPPAGIQTLTSPKPDFSAIRIAARGIARNDKNFAASNVLSLILEDRLRSRVPASRSAEVFVRSETHKLPGVIILGFLANRENSSDGRMSSNDEVFKTIARPITAEEFASARSRFLSEFGKRDAALFWLDADTYGIANIDADIKTSQNITLTDVQAFAERLHNSPMASVLVIAPPPSN